MLPIHDLRPEYVHYSATWVEWGLTAAGIALFVLLFYLFSKFVPIIPVVRTGEEKDYSRLRKIAFEKQMKTVIRKNKKGDTVVAGILILLALSFPSQVKAQEESPVKSVLQVGYYHVDSAHLLTATLRAKVEGKFSPLGGMEITFSQVRQNGETELGTGVTNDKGIVSFPVPGEVLASGGEKGVYSFGAAFAGKDKYPKATASTSMKPLKMEMSFFQKESEKTVNLAVQVQDDKGAWVPAENLEVQFYVPRTFSLLKVGKGTVSNGLTSLEFPASLPGNQRGFITLVAKIEENETYGNAEVSGTINWGKPLPAVKEVRRGLGDTNAPLWMVYTLIVLLSLVWFHYMYVIFTIFRIRYLGKS
jgi:hypothetical protein